MSISDDVEEEEVSDRVMCVLGVDEVVVTTAPLLVVKLMEPQAALVGLSMEALVAMGAESELLVVLGCVDLTDGWIVPP